MAALPQLELFATLPAPQQGSQNMGEVDGVGGGRRVAPQDKAGGELEREHGSILVGMARSAKQRRERGEELHTLLSFQEGLQQLTEQVDPREGASNRLRGDPAPGAAA